MGSTELTAEERIRELSAINAEVAEMVKQAGRAVNALTNRPLTQADDEDGDEDMTDGQRTLSSSDRQEAFKRHTIAFYTGIQSVTARLRRNVYGLEEAGIIGPETSTLQPSGESVRPPASGQPGRPPREETLRITNGGMGNLDVGWLNSKGNKVAAEKESELMEEAKELLQDELRRKDGT